MVPTSTLCSRKVRGKVGLESTNLADWTREVHALRRVPVCEVRAGELIRRHTLLDPAHDRIQDIVLCVVHESWLCIACRTERGCACATLSVASPRLDLYKISLEKGALTEL